MPTEETSRHYWNVVQTSINSSRAVWTEVSRRLEVLTSSETLDGPALVHNHRALPAFAESTSSTFIGIAVAASSPILRRHERLQLGNQNGEINLYRVPYET